MLVSYKWLKELVDLDVTSAELAEKMSTTGIEVEGVEVPSEGLSNLLLVMLFLVRMFQRHTCICVRWTLVMTNHVKLFVVLQM